MKRTLFLYLLLISVGVSAQTKSSSPVVSSRSRPFDNDWLFIKDTITNAEQPGYNDAKWRKLDLPHDWSIEDLPNQTPDSIIGPFNQTSPGGIFTGFTIGGTGWYRKKFLTEKAEQNKHVTIHFDGVYMNSDVWLNGHHLGNHPYGYTPFYYNITPYLKPAGEPNTIAVRVRNEGRNSRWYSGSGIYRHVWLITTNPAHIQQWGVYITTPAVSATAATVNIQADVINPQSNNSPITIKTSIADANGKTVATSQQGAANSN